MINIVVIALLAVMSGLQSWEGMERFGKIRKRWLGRIPNLPEEQLIPSDDTFRRVLDMLNAIYTAISVPAQHAQRARRKNLKSILAVGNCRHEAGGSEVWQTRYLIGNLSANAKRLSTCVRGHWDIENKVHLTLDMAYRKESIWQYDRTAETNLAAIRKLASTLFPIGDFGESIYSPQADDV